MTPRLVIGMLNYSSWSARAWLALKVSGIPFRTHCISLFIDEDFREQIAQFSGAGKVPIWVEGALTIHESLAIAEYAAEQAPEANLWPEAAPLRARARAISCEMATGFSAIRSEMPMNVRGKAHGFTPSAAAEAEIRRVFEIWSASLQSSGGPFLFGNFTIADCMYAPVLSRFSTYGVATPGDAERYAKAVQAHPVVAQWREVAQSDPALPSIDERLKG